MVTRIIASIVIMLSIFFMPFYVSFLLAILGIVYFNFYIEAVILMLLVDLLYGAPQDKFYDIPFISLILILISFIIIELLKRKLKFYK